MRDNMKKLAPGGALTLMIALVLAFVVPAMAGGPHNKATGTVTWTARTHLPPD